MNVIVILYYYSIVIFTMTMIIISFNIIIYIHFDWTPYLGVLLFSVCDITGKSSFPTRTDGTSQGYYISQQGGSSSSSSSSTSGMHLKPYSILENAIKTLLSLLSIGF